MRQPITESLRRLLARETRDGRTLAETITRNALNGDIRFIRLIFDRTERPVAERIADQAAHVDPIFAINAPDPAQPPADQSLCGVP